MPRATFNTPQIPHHAVSGNQAQTVPECRVSFIFYIIVFLQLHALPKRKKKSIILLCGVGVCVPTSREDKATLDDTQKRMQSSSV